MSFAQTISVQAADEAALRDLITTWHADQQGTAPGYRGARLLANLDQPGEYLLVVDFSSREDAERNNTRTETAAWADKLVTLIDGEPRYTNWRTVTDTNA
jgi:quinol monooxygenase YgiN